MTPEQALQNLVIVARAFVGNAEQHEALAASLKVIQEALSSGEKDQPDSGAVSVN